MAQSLMNFFQYFVQVTHIEISPLRDSIFYLGGLISLCVILGFFGYKLYRVIFSIVMLVLTILITVLLLEGVTEWLYIATTFSILSVVIAFLSYFSKKISAFVLVVLVVYGYILPFNLGLVYSILIALIFGVIAFLLPFIFIVLTSTIMASIEGTILLFNLLNNQTNPTLYIIGILIISILFQIFTNKDEFDKLIKFTRSHYG